jgi:hypothetical protein
MKTIKAISEAIANKRNDLFNESEYQKISDAIYWAWENWDASILATYFEGEKPEEPTFEFRIQWVENELNAVPENYSELIDSYDSRGIQ